MNTKSKSALSNGSKTDLPITSGSCESLPLLIEKIESMLAPGKLSGNFFCTGEQSKLLKSDASNVQSWPRFGIVLSGCLMLRSVEENRLEYRLCNVGDVWVIPELSFAQIPPEHSHESLSFVLRENYLRLTFNNFQYGISRSTWPPDIQFHLEDSLCISTVHVFNAFVRAVESGLVGELCMELLAILLKLIVNNLKNSHGEQRGKSYLTWRLAADYIEQDYASAISRQMLGAQLKITDSHLSKLFRRYAECSFLEYLRAHRLMRAKLLLRSTRLTVAEVADECGFQTTSFFIKCFKRRFSCTPARYRDFSISSASVIDERG